MLCCAFVRLEFESEWWLMAVPALPSAGAADDGDGVREAGVDVMTFGQYMRPTKKHMPVSHYVTPGGL